MYYKFVLYQCQSCVTILYIITVITEIKIIAILVNNAFKTVQQSAKDKEDICKRADRTAKISDARFHTLMGRIKMHYFRGLL